MKRLVAAAALLVVLALAGCAGVRSGEQKPTEGSGPPSAGQVRLVVSRDFGAAVLKDVTVTASGKLTVMRLLAEHATVDTQYGGGFVKAIDGLASSYGSVSGANAQDWFYWVDGVMADVGAGDYELHGGETVWWDYHAWARAMYLPGVIAAFPAPWTHGPQSLTTNVDTTAVRTWAARNRITIGSATPLTDKAPPAGIVVATAGEAESREWLRDRIAGKDGGVALVTTSGGVVALRALGGESGPRATGVCLALPNPEDGARPLLLLLVQGPEQLQSLLDQVTTATADARVGLAVVDGSPTALPWSAP